jgi:hypothetical protein
LFLLDQLNVNSVKGGAYGHPVHLLWFAHRELMACRLALDCYGEM